MCSSAHTSCALDHAKSLRSAARASAAIDMVSARGRCVASRLVDVDFLGSLFGCAVRSMRTRYYGTSAVSRFTRTVLE